MSTAFAERERRVLEDSVDILTGSTHPADYVHEAVVDVMGEAGSTSPSGRRPAQSFFFPLLPLSPPTSMSSSELSTRGNAPRVSDSDSNIRVVVAISSGSTVSSVPSENDTSDCSSLAL